MKAIMLAAAASCVLALSGCAALVAVVGSSAGAKAAVTAAYAAASQIAAADLMIPAASVLGAGMLGAATSTADTEKRMVGMSRSNVETCVGFTDRVSERLPEDVEKWTYERGACGIVIMLKSGYVTDVHASAFSCGRALQRC